MPICKKCGSELRNEATFCPICGMSLPRPQIFVKRLLKKMGKKERIEKTPKFEPEL